MTNITGEISNKVKFDILQENYTDKVNIWMKIQFKDCCSNMDVIIHNVLNKLNENINKKDLLFEDLQEIEQKSIEHIYYFYINNFIKGALPDPFWAD